LPLADEQFAREDLQPLTLKRYARGVAALTLMSVVVVNLVTIAAPVHLAGQGSTAPDSRRTAAELPLALS
jgi:hypothetical protein